MLVGVVETLPCFDLMEDLRDGFLFLFFFFVCLVRGDDDLVVVPMEKGLSWKEPALLDDVDIMFDLRRD
jgi:hypothetical protein